MKLYHNSRSTACRRPVGPLRSGMDVTLRLLGSAEAQSADLRVWREGQLCVIPMTRVDEDIFEAVLSAENPGLIWYDFCVTGRDGETVYYGNADDGMGGEGVQKYAPRAFQITVYDGIWSTPDYMRHGVMYQIFPDRFFRSAVPEKTRDEIMVHADWYDKPVLMPENGCANVARDFFGGDLKGIAQKLPYLKDLGVTVIYLNPIFKARSNHRYDTGDYTKIDPMLGTVEDFNALCEKAREMGMRVMLDGVFSHTGDDSRYFNRYGHYPDKGACQGKDSPYYKWFTFTHYPDRYMSWWGIDTLPTVNKHNREYEAFICGQDGVARHWLREGASAWRLDVADELPMPFLRRLKKAVIKEKPDSLLLGEVWEDASHKEAYGETRCYCTGDTLDSVMNYPLRDALIAFLTGQGTSSDLARLIYSQRENYPAPFYYSVMNLLGSHDRPRAINMLAGKSFEDMPYQTRDRAALTDGELALGKERYLKALRAVCALPGIPCVYYGDEAGVWGASDPWCRATYPWGREDKAFLEKVREVLRFRRDNPVLHTGFVHLLCPDADTLKIIRAFENGKDVFGDPQEDTNLTVTIRR